QGSYCCVQKRKLLVRPLFGKLTGKGTTLTGVEIPMRYLFEILGRPDSAGLTIASAGGAALSSGPGAGMSQSVIVSALWLMVLVLLNAAQAQSTARPKKSLDDLLAESDGIVVGTVSDVKARYVKDREIHTFVTLIDLEIVHGRYDAPRLILQLKGGEIDGDVLEIQGSPRFTPKDRVILFLKDNGHAIVPLVGWAQGVFRVFYDEKTGTERVKDHEGNQVVGVEGEELLIRGGHSAKAEIVGGRGSAGKTDDGSPSEQVLRQNPSSKSDAMTLRDFLNVITRKLKAKGLKGKPITSVKPEPPGYPGPESTSDVPPPRSQ
ncbi:MAG: hypothetical protein DMG06_31125, partial [Acidobacteria bacterium]